MRNKEVIILDAQICSVISQNAFGAELGNGHRFVAFFEHWDMDKNNLDVSQFVQVEMTAYDMSKGRIIVNQGQ